MPCHRFVNSRDAGCVGIKAMKRIDDDIVHIGGIVAFVYLVDVLLSYLMYYVCYVTSTNGKCLAFVIVCALFMFLMALGESR